MNALTRTIDRDDAVRSIAGRVVPDGTLLCSWAQSGGISAEAIGLEIERGNGEIVKALIRRHGENDLRHNPRIARDEFRLLTLLRERGVPVPEPYFFDESAELLPSPYIVVEFVDGETLFETDDPQAFGAGMAAPLVALHRLPALPDFDFLPRADAPLGEPPAILDEALQEGRIRDALATSWPPHPSNSDVVLHGDYWPGNVLWRGGAVTTVVDWEDARVGDPLADVATCRLELTMLVGAETAQAFTSAYHASSQIDTTNLPWWDLRAALRVCGRLESFGLDAETEVQVREQYRAFVDKAISSKGL